MRTHVKIMQMSCENTTCNNTKREKHVKPTGICKIM